MNRFLENDALALFKIANQETKHDHAGEVFYSPCDTHLSSSFCQPSAQSAQKGPLEYKTRKAEPVSSIGSETLKLEYEADVAGDAVQQRGRKRFVVGGTQRSGTAENAKAPRWAWRRPKLMSTRRQSKAIRDQSHEIICHGNITDLADTAARRAVEGFEHDELEEVACRIQPRSGEDTPP